MLHIVILRRQRDLNLAKLWLVGAGVLASGVTLPAGSDTSEPLATATASIYLIALATVQHILPSLPAQDRAGLLTAVSRLSASQASVRSQVKAGCLQLQHDLLLDYLQSGMDDVAVESSMCDWLKACPKLLWELAHKTSGTSKVLLSALYHTARYSQPGSLLQSALVEILPQLAPLFCMAVAQPGPGTPLHKQQPSAASVVKQRKHKAGGKHSQLGGQTAKADMPQQSNQLQRQKSSKHSGKRSATQTAGRGEIRQCQGHTQLNRAQHSEAVGPQDTAGLSASNHQHDSSIQQGSLQQAGQLQQQQQQSSVSLSDTCHGTNSPIVSVLIGPAANYPAELQHLAIDMLCYLPSLHPTLLKSLALACQLHTYTDSAISRLLAVVLHSAACTLPPDVYLSFTATLLSPPRVQYVSHSDGSAVTADWERHVLLVQCVCQRLYSYGEPRAVVNLLLPVILQQWQQFMQPAATAADTQCSEQLTYHQALFMGSHQHMQQQKQLAYAIINLVQSVDYCGSPSQDSHLMITSNSGRTYPASNPAPNLCTGADMVLGHAPDALLQALPHILTGYCLACASVAAADGMSKQEAGSSAFKAVAAGAAVTAAVQAAVRLILPLLDAVPQVVLPFLQHVTIVLTSSADKAGAGVAAAAGAEVCLSQQQQLEVVLQVVQLLLGHRSLHSLLLEGAGKSLLPELLQVLFKASGGLQQKTGSTTCVQTCLQLQAQLQMVLGHDL